MTVTGNKIAADALRYAGQGYVYGGDASRPGDWDCSSFVSYVLGHDLRLDLPGGRWGAPGMPPGDHGPVVTSYASWSGATTVNTPARGDLVCFVGTGPNGHIGIVLGANRMISALNEVVGTVRTPIAGYGPPGAPIVYRRVLGTTTVTPPAVRTAAKTGSGAPLIPVLVAAMAIPAAAVAAGVAVIALAPVVAEYAALRAGQAGYRKMRGTP